MFCFSLGIQNGLLPAVKTVAGSLKVLEIRLNLRVREDINLLEYSSVEIREPVG